MQVELSPEDAAFVREFAKEHGGVAPHQVVALALLMLKQHEEDTLKALESFSAEDWAELNRTIEEQRAHRAEQPGRVVDHEYFDELREMLLAKAQQKQRESRSA